MSHVEIDKFRIKIQPLWALFLKIKILKPYCTSACTVRLFCIEIICIN